MKTAFALAVIAAATPYSLRAEPSWVLVTEGDNQTVHIDTSSIRRIGSTTRFWSGRQFTSDNDAWELEVTLVEADCDRQRMRNIQEVVYGPNGEAQSTSSAGAWHYTISGSSGDAILTFACRYP